MIKIESEYLDKYANEHYQAIENYFNNKSRGYDIITIDKWIKNCFSKEWNLKKIILAKPNELEELSIIYKSKCINEFKIFHTYYSYLNKYTEITYFNMIHDEKRPYNAYQLLENLKVFICPYCNRNSIYNIKNSKKRTSELDHFYPQSIYPFFALSFYNLIPSCGICNKIKLDKDDKEYINPYDDRFDMNKNMKFSLKIEDSTFYHCVNGFNLNCKYNEKISDDEKNRIEANLDDFELKDLYQNHKDIILELIQKEAIYNESYLDELLTQYEGTLFKNREDLQRLISGGYVSDEEIGKRPLSKLVKDISEELGLK
jgi:hypothetical protein